MDFESDLAQIIKQQFDEQKILYKDNLSVSSLAARFLEMLHRRITPIPRDVHFSEEIHESLGKLKREKKPKQLENAAEAWEAVFSHTASLNKGRKRYLFFEHEM